MFKFLMGNVCWVTKRNIQIPIRELGETHINNILNCLLGLGDSFIPEVYEGKTRQEWITILTNELKRRKNG